MKATASLFAALALAGFPILAFAQELPPGSYQQSCGNIEMQGGTLTAICRAMDGREVRTALDVAQCTGEIANNNGQLQCNGSGQPPAYSGQGYPPQPGYPSQYGTAPGPGYAPPGNGYGPPPR